MIFFLKNEFQHESFIVYVKSVYVKPGFTQDILAQFANGHFTFKTIAYSFRSIEAIERPTICDYADLIDIFVLRKIKVHVLKFTNCF